MPRKLTSRSSLENLKREAKRWLRALREQDPAARSRLLAVHPDAPAEPGLRDVQHALAREHELPGWSALVAELSRVRMVEDPPRDAAIQRLLSAADRGDRAEVARVLDEHSDLVDARAPLVGHVGARTALHFAMNSRNGEVVSLLLSRGADPNIRDEGDNATPLHFAAERLDLAIVAELLRHGADPIGHGDHHDLEIIGWAAVFGKGDKATVVDHLLAHGARHNILSAVAMGAIDEIARIVAREPGQLDRVMDRTNHRRRPLHLAVVERQAGSLAALLGLGPELEAEDAAGMTPLDQAALIGEVEMARRLMDAGARVRMPAAVALEFDDAMDRLLAEDPDCLRPGGRWDKVIIRASENSTGAVIERLIARGASVHVRDDHRTAVDGTHGYSALHAAGFRGNLSAARALLRHGADPAGRDERYWGTPAGWADFAGQREVRDLILEGPIDIFDAITFDRLERIPSILARDPQAIDRRFGEQLSTKQARSDLDPVWTPIGFAIAGGKEAAARLLLSLGPDLHVRDAEGRTPLDLARALRRDGLIAAIEAAMTARRPGPEGALTGDELVAEFLRAACLDWRVGGSMRAFRRGDAGRLLGHGPELATANIYTAVVCGQVATVERLLAATPEAAVEIGGPRSWPPLLYLCAARLPGQSAEAAVEIARLLLGSGADPNVFYLGGNADIHYTALTAVLGRGEEQGSMHPAGPELTELLLEAGADPFDNQVLYNVFANHGSRRYLDDEIVWLLELMRRFSVRRGRESEWNDPLWPMFSMRGAPSLNDFDHYHHGSNFMLSAAIQANLLGLAAWMLRHGAGPNTPWGKHPRLESQAGLYEQATARGLDEMAALLLRYGAVPTGVELAGYHQFHAVALGADRSAAAALVRDHPEYLRDPRALFEAVERDLVDVVNMLLDLGMSPNVAAPAEGNRRALHVAAAAGAVRSATLLLARGAEVDARESNYAAIPLGVASWAGQPAMVELFGRSSRDVWELTHNGCIERLAEILGEDPAQARVVNGQGETPLMWLPNDSGRALAAARLLLEGGADPKARTGKGVAAEDIARRRGLEDVVALLRSKSAGG